MPVAQGGAPARQALLVGLGILCGLAVVVFLVTRVGTLTDGGEATISTGDPIFSPGPADELAEAIGETGPLLLQDTAQGDRDIWIQHRGEDSSRGWDVFAVRPEGAPRECFVEWVTDRRVFVDNCDETEYTEDGDGLLQYPVSVDSDGNLIINLNVSDN